VTDESAGIGDEITFERLTGNRNIETAAIQWVMGLERTAGRVPVDKRSDPRYPADIDSPPRVIEVKAVGADARGQDLPLEVAQIERAKVDVNFYLYVVDRIAQGNPANFRLKVFAGDRLARLITRVREQRYYELPVPVADFDGAPGEDALTEGG
jgi:hypothetical protein